MSISISIYRYRYKYIYIHTSVDCVVNTNWKILNEMGILKFIYNSKINTHNDFKVTHRHGQSGKNLTYVFLDEVKQGSDLPPCFTFIFIYKCPFMVYSVPYFSHFCPFLCDFTV